MSKRSTTSSFKRMHFVVLCGIKKSKVEFPQIIDIFANRADLLLHNIKGGMHGVVKLKFIICRGCLDEERVVLKNKSVKR